MLSKIKDFVVRHIAWLLTAAIAFLILFIGWGKYTSVLLPSLLAAIVMESFALAFVGIGLFVITEIKWHQVRQTDGKHYDIGTCIVIGAMILAVHILFAGCFFLVQFIE